jgi:hypothetical protein
MRECFTFRFLEKNDDKRSSLAIFFSSELSLDSIVKAIRNGVEEALVPKNVYIIVMDTFKSSLKTCKEDKSFKSEFDSFVGDTGDKLISLYVTSDGDIIDFDKDSKISAELQSAIFHAGMIFLFKKHKGVITSSPSYHFVKPSGDHADKFIRSSNLLVSGIEVTFLAISLLPYLKQEIKRIYVDTSSISYLVHVAVQLSGKFTNSPPFIESFESYAVFNKSFDFVEDGSSLIVISATTSGGLTKNLIRNTSFTNRQIVTLFHLKLPEGQIGIFDITPAVQKLTSKKEAECEFCKRGSKKIRISGDQFLPENPKHELLVIKKTDFHKDREEFFKEFATRNVLAWNRASTHLADLKEHFFIDVSQVINKVNEFPVFSKKLQRVINKNISRHVKTIIYLDDDGSGSLADKIKDSLDGDASEIIWLKWSDFDVQNLNNDASVLVVAGAITSGRRLLSVSRELRCINDLASITYLVGFSKLPTEESKEQLKKDLRQGGNEFIVLQECQLPRVKENTLTAWDWEIEQLKKYSCSDPLSGVVEELPQLLRERVEFLESDLTDLDRLFLPNPTGNKLTLRRTFAFWSDLGLEDRLGDATQSDVYWTIQSLLHDLRLKSDENGLASTYHTTLISPASFDRYNDGVIQACLLRSAKPVELNYAVDEEFSRQMTDVLFSVISNWSNNQGEATLEFLLALWLERLQLLEEHVERLLTLLTNEIPNMPVEVQFMLKQIGTQGSS